MEIRKLPVRRRVEEVVARGFLLVASSLAAIMLAWLLWRLGSVGLAHLDWQFLTSFPSRRAAASGVKPALAGSLWIAFIVLLSALPVGVLSGIYLNEYAPQHVGRLERLARNARRNGRGPRSALIRFAASVGRRVITSIRVSIANLAGVPSIVFGMLGLAIFVRAFGLGFVVLAGGLTLAILSLPIIIVATEEALKAVPASTREAAFGLGATKWQVTKDHVLPYAMPGILTGSILALARAVGETAPLILVGGSSALFFMPTDVFSYYTALPLQTFAWAAKPQAEFRELAAAGTVVLLAFIILMNLAAIVLRNHYRKKLKW